MSCEVEAVSPRYTGVHDSDEVCFLSRAAGAHVLCHDNNLVLKSGQRVQCGEEHAMRLAHQRPSFKNHLLELSSRRKGRGRHEFHTWLHARYNMGLA